MPLTAHLEPTADFASSAMVRVLAQGMRDLGLNPGLATPGALGQVATVALDEKRQLVGCALAQGGIGCLALLGRGLHHYTHEPSHRALVASRSVQDLLARWARLERYIHSRHHTQLLALADHSAHITQLARPGLPPPLPAEDLVVLGVLVALLEAIGATDITAQIAGLPTYPKPDTVALARLAEQRSTSTWVVSWAPTGDLAGKAAAQTAPAQTALAQIALAQTAPARTTPSQAAQLPNTAAPQAWPAQAQLAYHALCADLMNPLPLPALAQSLGAAPRSLQRSLRAAGLGYSQLLAEARCRSAAWWLLQTATPVAEVGFVCGYADQPHFTRNFRQRVGLTPLRYRTEFATPG